MACQFADNVYTQIFTPREYQVELLDAAKGQNTIICTNTSTTKTFIAVKLLQEMAWEMRTKSGKRALFVLDYQNTAIMTSHIKLLTDLNVINITENFSDIETWQNCIKKHSVLVTTIDICRWLIEANYLDLNVLNLIVIADCLYGERQILLEPLMTKYRQLTDNKPRILGLGSSLLGPQLQPDCLEDELQRLERLLCCSVNTASELVTLLRFCCHPKERLIECSQLAPLPLQQQLEAMVLHAQEFIDDHRFDPSEIYEDEFLEELRQVPDPKEEPRNILLNFLEILKDLGPWAADQAALSLLTLIEKLKVKVPYERHYLLLCMISTVMVRIRATCDLEFQDLSDVDRIKQYSTPKVLRFLEIIKQFKPAGERPKDVVETNTESTVITPSNTIPRQTRNKNVRALRRFHTPRSQQEDSLCALIFVRNRFTAKVVYTLLYVSLSFTFFSSNCLELITIS